MAKPSLETLSALGGAALVSPTEAEFAAESGLNLAATALHRFREAATRFEDERAKVAKSTRFSAAGREAELGDLALRELNELARHDGILGRAQAQLAELVAEARKVPVEDLTPAQLALLPRVYDRYASGIPSSCRLCSSTRPGPRRAHPRRVPVGAAQQAHAAGGHQRSAGRGARGCGGAATGREAQAAGAAARAGGRCRGRRVGPSSASCAA